MSTPGRSSHKHPTPHNPLMILTTLAILGGLYRLDHHYNGMLRYPALGLLTVLVAWLLLRKPPSNSLRGRRVLVTGAAHGIGKAIAIEAASRGATLVLWDIDGGALEEVAAEAREALRGTGYEVGAKDKRAVLTRVVDVGVEGEVEEGVREALRGHTGLDSVVSCAALLHGVSAGALSAAQVSRALAVNVGAPFSLVRHLLPHMVAGVKAINRVSHHHVKGGEEGGDGGGAGAHPTTTSTTTTTTTASGRASLGRARSGSSAPSTSTSSSSSSAAATSTAATSAAASSSSGPSPTSPPRATLVFLGSAMGALGASHLSDYAASKAALHGFADSLRQEVNRDGLAGKVGVHLVCPWLVGDSDMFKGAFSRVGWVGNLVKRLLPPLKVQAVAAHVLNGLAFSHGTHWVSYLPFFVRFATLIPKIVLAPSLTTYDALFGALGGRDGMQGWSGSPWNNDLAIKNKK